MEKIKCFRFILLIPILMLLLASCGKEKTTGPVDIRWDREICARCAMAISNRKFSAEVRGARKGKKSKVYKFDDIGCAVIWLDKQNWKDDPKTEIWVKDGNSDKWLDARKAWYTDVHNSPMDYGLLAQSEKSPNAMNFEQARKHIYKVEQRFNPHSGLPKDVQEIDVPSTDLKDKKKPEGQDKK